MTDQIVGFLEQVAKTIEWAIHPIVEYRGRKIKQVKDDKYMILDQDGHEHSTFEAAIRCIDRSDRLKADYESRLQS